MKWSDYIEIPLEATIARKLAVSLRTEQRQSFLRRKRRVLRTKIADQ